MSQTPVFVGRYQPATSISAIDRKMCPLGSRCSCVFSRMQSAEEESALTETQVHSPKISTEVRSWTDRGWKVVTADPHEIVLERQLNLPFCLNALLCLLTGFLWLGYWIPRARNPKIDTRIVTISANGDIATTRAAARR